MLCPFAGRFRQRHIVADGRFENKISQRSRSPLATSRLSDRPSKNVRKDSQSLEDRIEVFNDPLHRFLDQIKTRQRIIFRLYGDQNAIGGRYSIAVSRPRLGGQSIMTKSRPRPSGSSSEDSRVPALRQRPTPLQPISGRGQQIYSRIQRRRNSIPKILAAAKHIIG